MLESCEHSKRCKNYTNGWCDLDSEVLLPWHIWICFKEVAPCDDTLSERTLISANLHASMQLFFVMDKHKFLTFSIKMPSSSFSENLCSCRNADVEDLCYLMLMNMSLLGSECVKMIFDVESFVTWCWCLLSLLHHALEMCKTISNCFDLYSNLHLHQVFQPPSIANSMTLWRNSTLSHFVINMHIRRGNKWLTWTFCLPSYIWSTRNTHLMPENRREWNLQCDKYETGSYSYQLDKYLLALIQIFALKSQLWKCNFDHEIVLILGEWLQLSI